MGSNSNKVEEGDLTSFLSRAVEDLWSQAGRIGPDVTAVRDVAMTAFAGGIIDDHKYIVRKQGLECFNPSNPMFLDRKRRSSSSISAQ